MQLFYRKYGEGAPIVALHGLYASSDSWMGLVGELSKQHQLILVDLRNHGRSPHSPEHSYSLMSDDLLELFDKLVINQAILMGHSMGGKAAMHFALNYPERTKGLIVEDISPLGYSASNENVIFHQKIINALKLLQINSCTSRKEVEDSLFQKIPNMALCHFLLKNLRRNKNGELEWRINLSFIEKNLPLIMESIITENVLPIEVRSLFVKGSESTYVVEKDEEAIRLFFPYSSITTAQSAGHWIHNEQERDFMRYVKQYFSLLNSTD